MISYDLAKELKEAGLNFDFGQETVFDTNPSSYTFQYYPTLSELIEACGEQFLRLTQHPIDGLWRAESFNMYEFTKPSPEEAVARLYIALNKK